MCLASEYGETLAVTIGGIKSDFDRLKKLMSDCDIKVNTIYHEIEVGNLNAANGYKKYKELQGALRERRIIKHEFSLICNLMRTFDMDKAEASIQKTRNSIKNTERMNLEYRAGWDINIKQIMSV